MPDPLTNTPWADWAHRPIPGDASARQYTRLIGPAGETAILMFTPSAEIASQSAFVRVATILNNAGLAAPDILFQDGPTLVLSDLGATDMATALVTSPEMTSHIYEAVSDVLLHLHQLTAPDLPKLTPDVAGEMVRITAEQYSGAPHSGDALVAAMTHAMTRLAPVPTTLALRDFHAENLIWRPDRRGVARVGLLDFQDAFVAPAGYDLASLLRDARHDVSQDIYDDVVARFCTAASLPETPFRAQLACLGVQRNLRILGVFARLARQMGKTRYVAMLPRVWDHIQRDLAHPELRDLAAVVTDTVPAPDAAIASWGPI
mgnify:CR=1 FL=1